MPIACNCWVALHSQLTKLLKNDSLAIGYRCAQPDLPTEKTKKRFEYFLVLSKTGCAIYGTNTESLLKKICNQSGLTCLHAWQRMARQWH